MRIRLRPGLRAHLEAVDGSTLLRVPGDSLEIEPALEGAVAALLEGGARTVGSLPGEAEQVAELVRRLLLRGIVVPDVG